MASQCIVMPCALHIGGLCTAHVRSLSESADLRLGLTHRAEDARKGMRSRSLFGDDELGQPSDHLRRAAALALFEARRDKALEHLLGRVGSVRQTTRGRGGRGETDRCAMKITLGAKKKCDGARVYRARAAL